jgi:hypothetical protein
MRNVADLLSNVFVESVLLNHEIKTKKNPK